VNSVWAVVLATGFAGEGGGGTGSARADATVFRSPRKTAIFRIYIWRLHAPSTVIVGKRFAVARQWRPCGSALVAEVAMNGSLWLTGHVRDAGSSRQPQRGSSRLLGATVRNGLTGLTGRTHRRPRSCSPGPMTRVRTLIQACSPCPSAEAFIARPGHVGYPPMPGRGRDPSFLVPSAGLYGCERTPLRQPICARHSRRIARRADATSLDGSRAHHCEPAKGRRGNLDPSAIQDGLVGPQRPRGDISRALTRHFLLVHPPVKGPACSGLTRLHAPDRLDPCSTSVFPRYCADWPEE
jgi:hypothetical protein